MSATGDKRQSESRTSPLEDSPTTPSSGLGFAFRPSPLSLAASNLTTYNRSNTVGKTKTGESLLSLGFSKPQLGSPHSPKPLGINGISPPTGAGFKRKLDSSSSSESMVTPTKKSNLFMQCIEEKSSAVPQETEEGGGGGGFIFGQELASRVANADVKSGWGVASGDETTPPKDSNKELIGEEKAINTSSLTFSGQPSPSLPEVQKITGEEGERHVMQISCKLFVYDRSARLWKERGRGELRLNDAPQSEGVYQSRLVMRASGSYRVLLNTNVWSGMNCERVSPQSIRLTAQESDGEFGIYLIKGALKDIHAVFTSVDQRLQALRRSSSSSDAKQQAPPPVLSPPLPHEKEGGEREREKVRGASFDEESIVSDRNSALSSPDSSPERQRERLRVSKETLTTPSSESNDFIGGKGHEATSTNILLNSSADTKEAPPTDS
ncbi:PREDICTED: ran-binding protein 3-like isoform X2 [Amphimedon queenslandica]|uniref:RanBD1 domain-containing protein n=1 Tax=Amphimedon queenslandica TaxID=400682 RepID=A0AAN0J9T4_AMPQE|nr:PREDICTED: ran-binding protein 3-like isoform X2 [Amphimedon queenslandica]|eukprot:XP_019853468.1 PREDICTED: ran-binding protein 3-like isoform X2 [Amphimedon queenslandica]